MLTPMLMLFLYLATLCASQVSSESLPLCEPGNGCICSMTRERVLTDERTFLRAWLTCDEIPAGSKAFGRLNITYSYANDEKQGFAEVATDLIDETGKAFSTGVVELPQDWTRYTAMNGVFVMRIPW